MIKFELDEDDIAAGARLIGCPKSRIRAVAEIEAPRGAFELDKNGNPRPTILFERHYFHRLTGGRFDGVRVPGIEPPKQGKPPNDILSSPVPGGYGLFREQHEKLAYAAGLCREVYGVHDPAMKSASWGMFQIMCLYHAEAGHPTVQGFVNAMFRGADRHLDAFLKVVIRRGLDAALRDGDFAYFALRWNGRGYRKNRYDTRLKAVDNKWAAHYKEGRH